MVECRACRSNKNVQRVEDVTPQAIFDTRIKDFWAEDRTYVGRPIRVTGKLEFYCVPPHPSCLIPPVPGWKPLRGDKIEIYVNDTKVAETYTSDEGLFTAQVVFDVPGTFTVKARFPGSLTMKEAWSLPVMVEVMETKDEYEKAELMDKLVWIGLAAVVVGGILWFMERRREEEMLLLLS